MIRPSIDFFTWKKGLEVGDIFKAGLLLMRVDATRPIPATFRIKELYPRIAKVECYSSEYKYTAYINLVDLWLSRELFDIVPCGKEMIA